MPPPPLFYLSPEWDKTGILTRHSLVWDVLDGRHTELKDWEAAFNRFRLLERNWEAPAVMFQRGKQDADFLAACRQTFAISPRAWEAIKDLVGGSAEALPVEVVHRIDPERFEFAAIPSKDRPRYYLLHGLFNLPMRHGQRGYWDEKKNRFDLTLGQYDGLPPERCKRPWIDPEEFAGRHLFLFDEEWVASPEFVARVKEKKLTGLGMHPIAYEEKARPVPAKLKKTMPPPPRPDFALAAKGFSPKLAKQWQALWDWTTEALKNRGWPARKARIKPPADPAKLRDFEAKHKIKLPRVYFDVLTKFSGGVTVIHGRLPKADEDHFNAWEEVQGRLESLLFAFETELWSADVPGKEFREFKKWGDGMADAYPEQAYYQHARNKMPILIAGNGDYITLDLQTGVPTYISHEGDDRMQGKPLGKNFADFMTRWSWIGVPWSDYLPGADFYDPKANSIPEDTPALRLWHTWLRGLPLPAEEGP